jgi:pilus assembly protein Flp/PilA
LTLQGDVSVYGAATISLESSLPAIYVSNWSHSIDTTLDYQPYNYGVAGSATQMEVNVKRCFVKFLSDQSGATAIEYGLIAAGISLAIIAVVNGLGGNLNTMFASINNSLK